MPRGEASSRQARMELDSVLAVLPKSPPLPHFARSHACASVCTSRCPQGRGVLPAPTIAGIALKPKAWELEIWNKMSLSQSHRVKLGCTREKLGGSAPLLLP